MSGTRNEDERTSLLPNDQPNTLYRTLSRISEPAEPALPPDDTDTNATADKKTPASSSANVWATLSVLLVGVFISQTDASLVMAVYAKVASEFNDLDSGSWLMSAYILAQCVAQPLYGKLSDLFGRKALLQLSAFLIQVPFILLAIILVQLRLQMAEKGVESTERTWDKLKRIDFIGAFFLCSTLLAVCLILDLGGRKVGWTSQSILAFGGMAVLSAIGFVISALYAAEPILPLRLLTHYAVFTNSLMVFLQSSTQAALTLLIPVFFQVVKKASVAEAGAYLIPAFTGNLLGGLTSGYWIKRTGLFKVPTVVAPMLTMACMVLCLFTWHENISSWRASILAGALSSITYVQEAGREIRRIVVPAYVDSFHHVNYLGLACSLVTLTIAVFSKGQRLPKS
ncbi:hypothetical protein D0865_08626 [Hortaea werneckii]|uniref:Major facilitator superfamily (MFS) profile domain-containing protein n=1 Tax=Hortaea werneckii TaxID=91943 RepID=A0A3M7C6M4_HORWE|nr:hypothetical protein D0865_08626 [Hortaea werneckii]